MSGLVRTKFSIAKDLLTSLQFLNLLVSWQTINISYIYKSTMMRSPCKNFLKNAQWYELVLSYLFLSYPWSNMSKSNFLYPSLRACFRLYKLFFNLHTMFSILRLQIPQVVLCNNLLPLGNFIKSKVWLSYKRFISLVMASNHFPFWSCVIASLGLSGSHPNVSFTYSCGLHLLEAFLCLIDILTSSLVVELLSDAINVVNWNTMIMIFLIIINYIFPIFPN